MDIDAQLLLHAKPENVVRMIRALRVPVPVRRDGEPELRWRKRLVHVALDAIDLDADRARIAGILDEAETARGVRRE